MPTVSFTRALTRHVGPVEPVTVEGGTLTTVLDAAFQQLPRLRGYVLDDQGRVRKHVQVFIDGRPIASRDDLALPVGPDASVHVLQALSGG